MSRIQFLIARLALFATLLVAALVSSAMVADRESDPGSGVGPSTAPIPGQQEDARG